MNDADDKSDLHKSVPDGSVNTPEELKGSWPLPSIPCIFLESPAIRAILINPLRAKRFHDSVRGQITLAHVGFENSNDAPWIMVKRRRGLVRQSVSGAISTSLGFARSLLSPDGVYPTIASCLQSGFLAPSVIKAFEFLSTEAQRDILQNIKDTQHPQAYDDIVAILSLVSTGVAIKILENGFSIGD